MEMTSTEKFEADCEPVQAPRSWYAFLVETGKERRVSDWLTVRQFQPYWPRYKGQVKLNRHRRAIRPRSVIPGYLFVPLNLEPNWRLLTGTHAKAIGIRGVLRSGSSDYAILTEQHIEAIRNIEAALNESPVCATEGIPFKVGQRVRVNSEPWNWEGPIIRIDSRRQIVVEARMFGRATRIVVAASEIEAM